MFLQELGRDAWGWMPQPFVVSGNAADRAVLMNWQEYSGVLTWIPASPLNALGGYMKRADKYRVRPSGRGEGYGT